MTKSFKDEVLEEFFDESISDIQNRFGEFLQSDFCNIIESFKQFYVKKLESMGDKAKHIDFQYVIDDIIKEAHSIRNILMQSHTKMLMDSLDKVQNDLKFREAVGAKPAFSLTK